MGAIRCFEPQVVANHLLGLKDSKLRADMGLRLHWLQPTTGVGATDVKVTLVSLLLIFFTFLQIRSVTLAIPMKYRLLSRNVRIIIWLAKKRKCALCNIFLNCLTRTLAVEESFYGMVAYNLLHSTLNLSRFLLSLM